MVLPRDTVCGERRCTVGWGQRGKISRSRTDRGQCPWCPQTSAASPCGSWTAPVAVPVPAAVLRARPSLSLGSRSRRPLVLALAGDHSKISLDVLALALALRVHVVPRIRTLGGFLYQLAPPCLCQRWARIADLGVAALPCASASRTHLASQSVGLCQPSLEPFMSPPPSAAWDRVCT